MGCGMWCSVNVSHSFYNYPVRVHIIGLGGGPHYEGEGIRLVYTQRGVREWDE